MEVRVEGKVGGEKVVLVWRDGELAGDEAAVMLVRDQAALMEGRSIGVSPLWTTTTNHLSDQRSFLELCRMVMDVTSTKGDEPGPEPIPKGAVS